MPKPSFPAAGEAMPDANLTSYIDASFEARSLIRLCREQASTLADIVGVPQPAMQAGEDMARALDMAMTRLDLLHDLVEKSVEAEWKAAREARK